MSRPSFSIYDASAGSGKTYTLVKEYLKIILTASQNDAYRNILAITFTNKAVHEMKSRIVGSLSEFAKEDPSIKAEELMYDLSQEITLSKLQIKKKSQQIIKHIIHNYAAFDISTIDKFTHKVIRAFAHDLNLPSTFEVSVDSENLLIEAVDAIIAQAGEEETLTNLLVDFTMEKTDNDKSWDISREILEIGRLILNENNREEITQFHDKTISEFLGIKKKLIKICKEIEEENVKLAQKILNRLEQKGVDMTSFSKGTFPNHLKSIVLGKFNPENKMFRETEDIVLKKDAPDQAIIRDIIPEMLEILDRIYNKFEKRDFYTAFLKNITPLSLLNTVSNELAKIQEEQNTLSITEFNAIIHREIQNQPAPFIYERLGERYRHFFIDEFQDTSEMQWQNLIPLIDNALSSENHGEKGTLMIVGDPKQSIYRWRGGKAEQFIELSKNFNPFHNPDKKNFHLDKNYRSYSEIIEFNNSFFKTLANEFEHLDYKDLYENHSSQKKNDKIGGYVSITFLPIVDLTKEDEDEEPVNKSELYVQETLQTIRKAQENGFEYKDIVILTRKRCQGIAIANFLTKQNIPLLSSETLMIQNATEVRFIIHILKYLVNSSDLEAKAYFLEYLAQNRQTTIPIPDFIAQGMAINQEELFEEWLENIPIELSFKALRKKSLYESVEIIVSKFLSQKSNNGYVLYFLDIVLERDIRNQGSISDFLNYWNKNAEKFSIPSPEGNNAVRIMTIHKSKGLEFPVVIFPYAEEDYNKKPKNKLWIEAEEQEFGLSKVLIDNNKAIERFGFDAKQIYSQKKQEELLDNINVLYVALTRAEEQLYVISQDMKPKRDGEFASNMASFFLKYLIKKGDYIENKLIYEYGNPSKSSKQSKPMEGTKKIPFIVNHFNPINIKIAQKEAMMWGTQQQIAIEHGTVIHEILSFVKTKSDIDLAITKATEDGLISIHQKEIVYKTIFEIVTHDELEDYFEEGNIVWNEQTIIQKEGSILKPDRMVVKNNKEILLLDYKTGIALPKHKLQLESYETAINKMEYKVIKKKLVYIGEKIEVK